LSSLPAAPGAPLSAPEIVRHVVEQDKVLQQRRKIYAYDLTIVKEKLDSNGAVTNTTQKTDVITGGNRPGYDTRSNPGAPDEEDQKASEETPFSLVKILDHYLYSLEGEEIVDGVPCYKIAFTPKPDLPYHNREEKVLNAVSGHLWAAKKDFSLIRNEGVLLHPVSVAWVFASLEQFQFRSDSMKLPNGDYGPEQIQYSYLVSIPFSSFHERDTRNMSNYRLGNITTVSH
jgi:hypothetical protein